MESDGGGKMRPKRSQSGNKPYDRRTSIFGRFSSSVKDLSSLLIPSWLAGESTNNQLSKPVTEPPLKSEDKLNEVSGSQLVERLQSSSKKAAASISYSSSSDNVPADTTERPSGLGGIDQQANLLSKNNSSSYKPNKSASYVRMSDSFLNEQNDTNLNITETRPIMVSTGSFSRSQTQSGAKKQKLWTPEIARQGKPMVPPSRDKPAFNSVLFGSMNQGDTSIFGDSFRESSFYSGKTRYGGASAERRQSLNKSLPYQSSLPLRKQVKANKMNNSYQAVTSATAQRILETLDRISTPLGDAKKLPQPETSNDSVLSFTPSSYRRTSLLRTNRSVTRPLELPKGPPTKQYQMASPAEVRKNRYRPTEKNQQISSETTGDDSSSGETDQAKLIISQEKTVVIDAKRESTLKEQLSSTTPISGKMKTKKFSQHISSKIDDDEVPEIPALRTDFTLPVSSIVPISLSSFPAKSTEKAKNSIPSSTHTNSTTLQFTFSTPIQKSHGGHSLVNTNDKDFTFSSPIQASKPCASGAEEAPKWSPEPAVGASSVTSAAFSQCSTPVWGSTKAKPKASSPDIGGTSSSFKSYSKWGDKDCSAAADGPGMLAPASSLKKGSVMDILGGGSKNATSSSPAAPAVSNSEDLMAKFRKPPGDWECDTCMIQNKASSTKCVACETPKPGAKKPDIPVAQKEAKPNNEVEISKDLLSKFRPTGNWECDTCMLSNKPEANKCVACEAARPGSKAPEADKANNNSLSSLFKKPAGNWECDTCMVQNSATVNNCVACESSKPGSQSASKELKSASTNGPSSGVTLNPGGGFSFNIPTTSATTEGSGGFKFGNTIEKSSAKTAVPGTGFVFGQTSTDSKPKNNNASESTGGGFKFGASESTGGGFKFGANTSSIPISTTKTESPTVQPSSSSTSTSSVDSKVSQGFQFGSNTQTDKPTENCVQTSSLFMKSSESENKTDNLAASKVGFQFSSVPNGPTSNAVSNFIDSNKEISNTDKPTTVQAPSFNFGGSSNSLKESKTSTPSFSFSSQPSVTISPAAQISNKPTTGLFTFGSSQPAAPNPEKATGLGMGKSLSDTSSSLPVVNGGFGSFANNTQSLKDKPVSNEAVGFGASSAPAVFAFGQSAPAAPQKRSVDLNETGPASKKSAGNQPVTNGLFSFGASNAPAPAFGSALGTNSAAPAAGGFGGFGAAASAGPAPGGGFGFGSTGPSFGQTPQAAAPAFGGTSMQPASGGFNFNSKPDFNFSSGSSQGSAPFQFGGNSNVNATPIPAAPASGLFQFSSTPSANVAPVFGGASAPAPAPAGGIGNFSIGSSTEGRRPMKKAIRKLPKR